MTSRLRSDREIDRTASKTTTKYFFIVVLTGAAIGLLIGIVWTIAGILHFHSLW